MFRRIDMILKAWAFIQAYQDKIAAIHERIAADPGSPENATLLEKAEHYGRLVRDLLDIVYRPRLVGASPGEPLAADDPCVAEFEAACARLEEAGEAL